MNNYLRLNLKIWGIFFSTLLGSISVYHAQIAYVPDLVTDQVYVIDGTTQSIVDSIFLDANSYQVSVSKDGKSVIVGTNDSTVYQISTETNTIIAAFKLPFNPTPIWLNEDGSKFYAGYDDGYFVVNTADSTVKANIALGVGVEQSSIVANADQSRLYTVGGGSGACVSILDGINDEVFNSPFLILACFGATSLDIDITPDDESLYIADPGMQQVYVVNTRTQSVNDTLILTDSISVAGPLGIAVTPDGSEVYVSNTNQKVIVINTSDNTAADSVDIGGEGLAVSATPDGSQVYVGFPGGVKVIDVATHMEDTTIILGPNVNVNFLGKFVSSALGSTGIDDYLDTETGFSLLQNPAKDVLNVLLDARKSGEGNMHIFDLSGRLIQTEKVYLTGDSQTLSMDIQNLSKGVYMVSLEIDQGIYSEKFIKTE